MHRAAHYLVGRAGSDLRQRRLLLVAVATPLGVGVALGKAAPLRGPEAWLFAFGAVLALVLSVEAAVRATEVSGE